MSAANLDKPTLRHQCLAARERIAAEIVTGAPRHVAEHLLQFIAPQGGTVAGYRPIRSELDITLALEQFSARGHTICLPVVKPDNLSLCFRSWKPGAALVKGKYSIEVPPESEPVVVPDVVIVPLVAFDEAGHRIGYGTGYYDRTIKLLRESGKKVHIVGAGYSAQMIAPIPATAADEKLDAIITEKGIYRFT